MHPISVFTQEIRLYGCLLRASICSVSHRSLMRICRATLRAGEFVIDRQGYWVSRYDQIEADRA